MRKNEKNKKKMNEKEINQYSQSVKIVICNNILW